MESILKEDTRLSMGLQILRKKINDLESLALSVETQIDRQMSMVNERTRRMESLLKKSKEFSEHLEKNIKIARSLGEIHSILLEEEANQEKLKDNKLNSLKEKSTLESKFATKHFLESKKNKYLDKVASKKNVEQAKDEKKPKFQFGESPFLNIDFVSSLHKKDMDSSV